MDIGEVIIERINGELTGRNLIERGGKKINIPMSWTHPDDFDKELSNFIIQPDTSYDIEKIETILDLDKKMSALYHFANEGRRSVVRLQISKLEEELTNVSSLVPKEAEIFLAYISEIKQIYRI
jgi:hypothetical protein